MYQSLDYQLVVLYILWFYFVDLVTMNPMLAIFVVYLLERGLRMIRTTLGANNLAKKSMLDKKFLM